MRRFARQAAEWHVIGLRRLRVSVISALVVFVISAMSLGRDPDGSAVPPRVDSAREAASDASAASVDVRAVRWSESLLWIAIVLLVLVVSASAIVVFSRRFRSFLLRGKRKPTPNSDVWSMHQLPEELRIDDGGGPDRGGGETDDGRSRFDPNEDPPDGPPVA